jgi:hypothetical protein
MKERKVTFSIRYSTRGKLQEEARNCVEPQ